MVQIDSAAPKPSLLARPDWMRGRLRLHKTHTTLSFWRDATPTGLSVITLQAELQDDVQDATPCSGVRIATRGQEEGSGTETTASSLPALFFPCLPSTVRIFLNTACPIGNPRNFVDAEQLPVMNLHGCT